MNVLITGADGFIGKNLQNQLRSRKDINVILYTKQNSIDQLNALVEQADFIFHLAGVNRPLSEDEFKKGNRDFTHALCEALVSVDKKTPIIYTSSTQAGLSNPYGDSKLAAEEVLEFYAQTHQIPVYSYRLPNVFGKWAKPNYNSVVATFCFNIIRDIDIQINNSDAPLNLVYIDDVISHFLSVMDAPVIGAFHQCVITPVYQTTVGDVALQLKAFRNSRTNLISEQVGTGFIRALYSTYVSYLPSELFSYEVAKHSDSRGDFVEMLKTKDSGQFSFFTAHPGITRGGHYHHSKTEKFLVIKGQACFRFRHMMTQEYYELKTCGDKPEIVETVPGWTHDITNIGLDEMIVMLWANEIFDRERPDTFACEL